MAVSIPRHELVVSDHLAMMLHVYCLSSGAPLRKFGCDGVGPGQFRFEWGGLCFAPARGDTLLVPESENDRVQEVSADDGTHVRFIGDGVVTVPVAAAADAHAVAVTERDHTVAVFCYATGALTCRFGAIGNGPGQLFVPSGVRVLYRHGRRVVMVVDSGNTRLVVFDATTGEATEDVVALAAATLCPRDAVDSGDGAWIVCGAMDVLARVRDVPAPAATDVGVCPLPGARMSKVEALRRGGLAVRLRNQVHVFMDLSVRFAWMGACVAVGRGMAATAGGPSTRSRTRRG